MGQHSIPPEAQHVWVHQRGQYGSPMPGVVAGWQHSWEGQVAIALRGTVLVRWLPADEVRPATDDSRQR